MTAIENLLIAKHPRLNTNFFSGLFKTPDFRRKDGEAIDFAASWLKQADLLDVSNRPAGTLA